MQGAGDAEEDLKCLARIAAGEASALEELLGRHAGGLSRFLRKLTDDPSAVEDALQEATLSVWRHAGTFRGETTPRAWLYTVARNAMMRQKRGKRPEPVDDASLEDLGARAGWGDQRSGARIEKTLADRESLRRAFDSLGEEHREILMLIDGEELSLKEAADALGLSLAATKSRLHRARLSVMGTIDKEIADAR